MDRTDFNRASLFNALLIVAVIGMSIITAFLAIENHQLKHPDGPPYVKPSATFDTLEVSLAGGVGKLACSSSVLFILSADCPHCLNTLPAWNAVNRTATEMGWKVIGVLVDGTDEDAMRVDSAGAEFLILINADKNLYQRLNLTGVPSTIVLYEGHVVNGWTGEPESGFYEDVINVLSTPPNT